MHVFRLENTIQRYAWGSADGIPSVLGIPNPSGEPLAELWMGAHPKAPSQLRTPEGSRPLDAYIREDPVGCLGAATVNRFGPSLPFLLKALGAARPLSIQAHPGKRKAEHGFERENRAGIPLDAPERNYRDPNHKPEQAIALTRFEALCGFRPVAEIIETIRLLAPDEHLRFLSRLERNPGRIELSVFFYSLISLAEDVRRRMLDALSLRLRELLAAAALEPDRRASFELALKLRELYPDDIGALAPFIFNHLVLEPGQSIFISPGEPHAYLSGTALEIMANSDNVIRGALTEKHIDLPELISVLSFNTGKPAIAAPQPRGDGEDCYPIQAPDFALSTIRVDGELRRRVEGPEILLCLGGKLRVRNGGHHLELERGLSAFVRADAGEYVLTGSGTLCRASLPLTT